MRSELNNQKFGWYKRNITRTTYTKLDLCKTTTNSTKVQIQKLVIYRKDYVGYLELRFFLCNCVSN